jgi:hypothetical protein
MAKRRAEVETETESDLVNRAREAISRCHWEIGECADKWTERYARGRTDADFGALIGLTGDQVYQRRRVWQQFGELADQFEHLKWSHFYAALNWEDAGDCLKWADDMQATVAQMRAWRRAQRGEDLTEAAEEEAPFDADPHYLPVEMGYVQDPSGQRGAGGRTWPRSGVDRDEESAAMAFAARQSEEANPGEEPYSPFGKGARGKKATAAAPESPQEKSVLDWKRVLASLERCNSALTPEMLEVYAEVPLSIRERLSSALESISNKLAGVA